MPALIDPDLPLEVEAAVSVIGSRAQAEILRRLSRLGPSTAGELADATGISRPSLNRHLVALQKAGVVAATPPAGDRAGKTVKYAAQIDRVRELAEKYLRYVSGG
ncbi:ArsR/SmtB family transcription factor [Arthrobacter pityocampae]|uniref:ArsR/SmtB family transcription factor n=1 Tax=Arthrobacter pityocampae TaxID=547334 RepID=UPI003736BE5D